MYLILSRKALAALGVMLVVAACGGDGGADDVSGTTIAPGATPTVGEPLENIAGLSESCAAISNLSLALTNAISGDVGNVDDFIATAKSQAPSDIHPAIDVMGDAIHEIQAFYEKIGGNPLLDPSLIQKLSEDELAEFDQIFDNDEADAAFDQLAAWAEEECVPLGG